MWLQGSALVDTPKSTMRHGELLGSFWGGGKFHEIPKLLSPRKPLATESIFSHVTPQVKSLVLGLLDADQEHRVDFVGRPKGVSKEIENTCSSML